MYLKGYGVPMDKKMAVLWYQLAAFQKYERAIQSLKTIYEYSPIDAREEFTLVVPLYLSEHWPTNFIHSNLSVDCKLAIYEMFLILRSSDWFSGEDCTFPVELVFLLGKYIIRHWNFGMPFLK